jgi:hypothetical protein
MNLQELAIRESGMYRHLIFSAYVGVAGKILYFYKKKYNNIVWHAKLIAHKKLQKSTRVKSGYSHMAGMARNTRNSHRPEHYKEIPDGYRRGVCSVCGLDKSAVWLTAAPCEAKYWRSCSQYFGGKCAQHRFRCLRSTWPLPPTEKATAPRPAQPVQDAGNRAARGGAQLGKMKK